MIGFLGGSFGEPNEKGHLVVNVDLDGVRI
jgi:hypothetical protein